jgi:hypothetical protein
VAVGRLTPALAWALMVGYVVRRRNGGGPGWQAAQAAVGFALHAAAVNLAPIHFTVVGARAQ